MQDKVNPEGNEKGKIERRCVGVIVQFRKTDAEGVQGSGRTGF